MEKAPAYGQIVRAETRRGTSVKIEVTSIDAEGPKGWDVFGYRVGVSNTQKASAFPRRYFVRRTGVEVSS